MITTSSGMVVTNAAQQQEIRRADFRNSHSVGHWMTVNRNGKIVEIDEKLWERLGYGHASFMLGQSYDMLLPEDMRESHVANFDLWWKDLRSQPIKMNSRTQKDFIPVVHANGSQMACSVSVFPYNDRANHTSLFDIPGTSPTTTVEEAIKIIVHFEYAMVEVVFLSDLLSDKALNLLISE